MLPKDDGRRRKITDRNIRKLLKSNNGSYRLTVPIEMVKELGWKEKQKVVFEKKGDSLKIKDWKK